MLLDDDELEMVSGGDMGPDDRPHYSMGNAEIKRCVCCCGNVIEWDTTKEKNPPKICPDCYTSIGFDNFVQDDIKDFNNIGNIMRVL